jgi:2-polyprenyl-3-methyl-5-hydroxy-6-metoxy-1,4-benzoquinol methylase
MNKKDGVHYREFKGWIDFYNPSESEIKQLDHEFRKLEFRRDISLLDVGFGNGSLMKWARDRSVKVSGVEINENLIAEAKAVGIDVYNSLDLIPPDSFEYITFMDVLEHLDSSEIDKTFIEAKRIIKQEGVLIARFPNCQSPAGLIEQFGDETHKSMLSLPIIRNKLKKNGFEIVLVSNAKPITDFDNRMSRRALRIIKKPFKGLLQAIYRLAFGSGDVSLSPSLIIAARVKI